MSSNPPQLPPAAPGWIRSRARPSTSSSSIANGSRNQPDHQEQQQQSEGTEATSLRAQPILGSSPFASSLSAFFPQASGSSSTATTAGQAGGDLGDYPLFSSRRAAGKTSSGKTASTSPPFGFSPPSNHQSLPSAAHNSPPVALAHSSTMLSPNPPLGSSNLPYTSNATARMRRPSVLATTSLLADEDEDTSQLREEQFRRGTGDTYNSSPSGSRFGSVSIDGQDEPRNVMLSGEDMDMDFADANGALPSAGIVAGGPTTRTAAIAIPGRARSSSQSSSVMASSAHLARSPSAWPNSPPRSGFTPSANPQHLLARLTSEQQQAMVASASSASSAYYMIPTSYRQAMSAGAGGDLLLGNVDEEVIDDQDEDDDEMLLSSKPSTTSSRKASSAGLSRSFNPLNPYSERPTPGSKRDALRESERDAMNMDDSPLPSPVNKDAGMMQAFRLPARNPVLSEISQPSTSLLRSSKSSPALADMNPFPQQGVEMNFSPTQRDRRQTGPTNSIPFPQSNPPTPTTPPPHTNQANPRSNQSLRRSQSASHRPSELSCFMKKHGTPSMESDTPPLTAPPASNTFRYQRANSLTDFSRLQRQAGFHLQPLTPVGTMPVENASSAVDMAGQATAIDNSVGKDRPASGSSGSDSPNTGPRVVRRAVSHKKGSLMVSSAGFLHFIQRSRLMRALFADVAQFQPKSKDHLRTMAQLRLETGEFEVASEAALHRISQSTAAAPSALATPSRRNTTAGISGVPSPFSALPRTSAFGYNVDSTAGPSGTNARPTSSHGGKPPFFNPVRNRFPESVADEEEDIDSSGSEPDYASAAEAGFDPASASDTGGGMMPGDEEEVSSNAGGDMSNGDGNGFANRSAWTLRDPALYKPLTPGTGGRPAAEMDVSGVKAPRIHRTDRVSAIAIAIFSLKLVEHGSTWQAEIQRQ